ncbi:hypothetical protein ACJX0J_031289, partial [Zea mays]
MKINMLSFFLSNKWHTRSNMGMQSRAGCAGCDEKLDKTRICMHHMYFQISAWQESGTYTKNIQISAWQDAKLVLHFTGCLSASTEERWKDIPQPSSKITKFYKYFLEDDNFNKSMSMIICDQREYIENP